MAWGAEVQKIDVVSKTLNVDAEHLKCIMSKSANTIACLYLIDTQVADIDKRVYKYGFTENVTRRFKEHMKRYGDNIVLDTFIFIPSSELSRAEAEFRQSVSRYKHSKDGESELISLCPESHINIKTIFKTISDKHCGNMKQQITIYENKIRDLTHQYELRLRDKDNELLVKDIEIEKLQSRVQLSEKEIALRDKDIEILNLRLQLVHT